MLPDAAQLCSGAAGKIARIRFRSAARRETCSKLETIRDWGARFQSVSEPRADTPTDAGKVIMTVFGGIAEFERDLIRERTQAGRAAAKFGGVRFGRPGKLSPGHTKVAQPLIEEGKSRPRGRRDLQRRRKQ